jgi:hypothetical protein
MPRNFEFPLLQGQLNRTSFSQAEQQPFLIRDAKQIAALKASLETYRYLRCFR